MRSGQRLDCYASAFGHAVQRVVGDMERLILNFMKVIKNKDGLRIRTPPMPR